MNISIQDFLACVAYHYPTSYIEVPPEVANSLLIDDPNSEQIYIEVVNHVYRLWTRFGWDNEIRHREYHIAIHKALMAKAHSEQPKQDTVRLGIQRGIDLARASGNEAVAKALEETLKNL